eukprot:17277-Heterococcus_DN1.PRE.2
MQEVRGAFAHTHQLGAAASPRTAFPCSHLVYDAYHHCEPVTALDSPPKCFKALPGSALAQEDLCQQRSVLAAPSPTAADQSTTCSVLTSILEATTYQEFSRATAALCAELLLESQPLQRSDRNRLLLHNHTMRAEAKPKTNPIIQSAAGDLQEGDLQHSSHAALRSLQFSKYTAHGLDALALSTADGKRAHYLQHGPTVLLADLNWSCARLSTYLIVCDQQVSTLLLCAWNINDYSNLACELELVWCCATPTVSRAV